MLGEGISAHVLRVLHEGLECALKTGLDQEDSDLFREEVEYLELLDGAGGAPVPLGFCPEVPALLMTFCGADDLLGYLEKGDRNGGYELRHILVLALRVTERLQEVHQAGVVHCDFKPDNVTVKLDAEENLASVHIIDFGFSRCVGERHKPMKKPETLRWYCACTFSRAPMTTKCDMPGLAAVF